MIHLLNTFLDDWNEHPQFAEAWKRAQEDVGNRYFVHWMAIEKFDAKVKEMRNTMVITAENNKIVLDDTSLMHEIENAIWMQNRFADPMIADRAILKYGLWIKGCFKDEPDLWIYDTVTKPRQSLRATLASPGDTFLHYFQDLFNFE